MVAPTNTQPFVDKNGFMTQVTRIWAEDVNRAIPILGTGSPEGNIPGLVGQLYVDTTGSAGSVLYVKKLAAIGGDNTQGWSL